MEALYVFLGTMLTLVGGIVTLIITQKYEFKKAQLQREIAAEKVADSLAEATTKVAKITAETAQRTDGKLDQIHILVNDRLSTALEKIGALEELVAKLIAAAKKTDSPAKVEEVAKLTEGSIPAQHVNTPPKTK